MIANPVFQFGVFGQTADGNKIPAWWYRYAGDFTWHYVGPFKSEEAAIAAAQDDDDVEWPNSSACQRRTS